MGTPVVAGGGVDSCECLDSATFPLGEAGATGAGTADTLVAFAGRGSDDRCDDVCVVVVIVRFTTSGCEEWLIAGTEARFDERKENE